MYLQVSVDLSEAAGTIAEKTFDVSPTSVYGVLVGVLFVLCLLLYRSKEKMNKRLWETVTESIRFNEKLASTLEDLADSQESQLDIIKQEIKERHEELVRFIQDK